MPTYYKGILNSYYYDSKKKLYDLLFNSSVNTLFIGGTMMPDSQHQLCEVNDPASISQSGLKLRLDG